MRYHATKFVMSRSQDRDLGLNDQLKNIECTEGRMAFRAQMKINRKLSVTEVKEVI